MNEWMTELMNERTNKRMNECDPRTLYGLTPVTGKKCQGIETHTGGLYRPF